MRTVSYTHLFWDDQYKDKFQLSSGFYGAPTRKTHPRGNVSLIPTHLHATNDRFLDEFPYDVLLLSTTPVNRHGYVWSGLSAPCYRAIEEAGMVAVSYTHLHHLNVFGEIGLCRQLLLALDVQRGVGAGDEAGVFASVTRGHAHVLPLAVAGKQAAHRGQHEPSVGLDKAHHGAQRVGVGGHQGVVSLPAQEGLHPALSQPHGRIAHVLQLAQDVYKRQPSCQ